MNPIDCRTCRWFDDMSCTRIYKCVDGHLYEHQRIVRLYVVTEQQEKPEPPRDEA